MAETSTSVILKGVNTFYSKRFLKPFFQDQRIIQFGDKRPLPEGEGKTIEWFRYNEISVGLTAGVIDAKLTSETSDPSATSITGQAVTKTISEFGAFSKHTLLLKKTHIDRNLGGVSALWGNHGAHNVDLYTQQTLVSQLHPVRADLDTTFGRGFQIKTGTTPTTTSLISTDFGGNTAFGGTADDANQAVLVFTSGPAKGYGTVITNSATSTDITLTYESIPVAPNALDFFHVVTPAGLSAATSNFEDSVQTDTVRRAVRILRQYNAPTFGDHYAGVLSPEAEEGLMSDAEWTNVMQYSAALGEMGMGLFKGEVGMWGGVRWVKTTIPFKAPTTADPAIDGTTLGVGANGSNYSVAPYAAGLGFTVSYVFGQNCFGVTGFRDASGLIRPGIKITNPGSQTTNDPLGRHSTVGWHTFFEATVLNALHGVQMWSAEPQI